MNMMSISTGLKNGLKSFLYHSGVVSILRRGAKKNALTVVMFHRILPQDDARSSTADRTYTIDQAVFDDFLRFLKREYQPVSLNQVEDAVRGRGRLPSRAVLVTFDDGWEDTARYAAPALAKHGIPSVVFVTTGIFIREDTLWRDVADILRRSGHLPTDLRAEDLSVSNRNSLLSKALDRAGSQVRPLMMAQADISNIRTQGMAIGAHGVTHKHLAYSENAPAELAESKATLEEITGQTVASFAFPHGSYSPDVLQSGLACGYEALFTSDSILNALKDGHLTSPILGRIALSQVDIVGANGKFSSARAAFFLFFRKIARLDHSMESGANY